MIGILAFLAMGLGMSFMLPDGAEDDALVRDGDLASEDPSLKLDGSSDLPGQIDLLDFVPSDFGDEITDDMSDDPVLEPAAPELVDLAAEGAENNQIGTSNAPYENDFDLSAFEKVEFAENVDNEIVGTDRSDLLVGGHLSDLVDGDAGDDYLYGGQGSDTLLGGEGNDLIVAVANPFIGDESAASELHGGEGNDTLIGENDDLLVGGDGIDSFHVFSDDGETGAIAHISDFDASAESLLIEIRDGQMGGELDFDVRQAETGVEVVVNGMPVVFLEGVEQTSELNIQARSVGY
jgi:Ca2+-binding RTX toxin-like protein